MYLDLLWLAWAFVGYVLLYRQKHASWPPAKRPSVKGGTTAKKPACTHPEVEQVEIGDGILAPREVVAKICTSCYAQLPADYSSPGSVIMTDENSVPYPYEGCPVRAQLIFNEAQERLATGKEVNQCHE